VLQRAAVTAGKLFPKMTFSAALINTVIISASQFYFILLIFLKRKI
jgi:hypothetical protein